MNNNNRSTMNIENLFKGDLKAVQEEFGFDLCAIQEQIESSLDALKTARMMVKDTEHLDWGEKAKYDKTIEQSSKILLDSIKVKEKILQERSNFVQDQSRWDSEEAVYVILMSVYQIAEKTLSPTQFKKLDIQLKTLKNKTVKELKEFVTV